MVGLRVRSALPFLVFATAACGGGGTPPTAPTAPIASAPSANVLPDAHSADSPPPGPCDGSSRARQCVVRLEEAREASAPIDDLVEDLVRAYVAGGLEESASKSIVKVLSETGDPRAARVFTKAFVDYGKIKNDDDVKYAAQGTTRLAQLGKATDPALVGALWDCFARFRPSKATSINLVKDLHEAVLAVKDKSYGPKAVLKLSAPVTDQKDPTQGMDEIQFWQATSVRLIGELRYAPAVKPLVMVLLTPTKRDLAYIVGFALTRMPSDAEPVLIAALEGSDPELAALARRHPDDSHVPRIAEPLATISRPAGYEAILRALAKAPNDQNRAHLALMLTRFPSSARSIKAYLDAYAKVAPTAVLPLMGGASARALMAQSSAGFFDPSLTDWLLRENATAKGEAADYLTPAALPAAIKLMTQSTSKVVGAAVSKIPGQAIEKDMYKAALFALDGCKKDVNCYLRLLDTPVPASPPAAKMGHVKAAWMAGIHGDATTKGLLVASLDKVKDGSVRLALLDAIDHLSPQGDVAAAEKLEAIAAADKKAGVHHMSDELVHTALRLRSRAP